MDQDQARAVRAILQYDDTSTAAELVYYFVHELGVSGFEAWEAVYQRGGDVPESFQPSRQQVYRRECCASFPC